MDINLVGYNIINGHTGGIGLVLRMMDQANTELGVLFETNLMCSIYMRCSSGYCMLAYEAPRKHQGRISNLLKNYPHWKIEAQQAFAPHVLIFQLLMGVNRWFIVG